MPARSRRIRAKLNARASRLRRHTLDRVIAPARLWRRDVPAEIEFWREWLQTRGSEWHEEYAMRIDPDASLQEPLITDRLDRFESSKVSIIDVGAGPLTTLGKKHPDRDLEITAVDPLADQYDQLLREAGVDPPVRTLKCAGEDLVSAFGPASFDIAYARNAIDHSVHPVEIVRNMVAVVRPGGFMALRHYREEGASTGWVQLHQWNFNLRDGDLALWGRRESHNLTELLAGQATVECSIDPDSHKTPWILAVIEKLR